MGCIKPIAIPNTAGPGTIRVPCGNCPGCKNQRAAWWAFRLQEEAKKHHQSLFITLTYDDDHIKGSPNGLLTLNKTDLQTFFKTLRKQSGSKTIKYYACGEYGGTTFRPHYHSILFDATPLQVVRAWNNGNARCDQVTPASIRYVTGYICKPSIVDARDPNDDRQKEKAFISKGLGLNYLSDELINYHRDGANSFTTMPGGVKQPLPRYFRDRLFTPEERSEMNEKTYARMEAKRRKEIEACPRPELYEENRRAAIAAAMEKYHSQRYSKRNKI